MAAERSDMSMYGFGSLALVGILLLDHVMLEFSGPVAKPTPLNNRFGETR